MEAGLVKTVAPESVGIDPDKLAELLTRARREIDDGLLPSCQIAVAREGELVAFESFGDSPAEVPRYVIFSCTKGFVMGAMLQVLAEHDLDLSAKVTDYIPEFGTNGKDVVTVEQLMLHQGGFPYAPMGPPEWSSSEGRRSTFAKWRLDWEPGSTFEYHLLSAHWVMVELLETLTGAEYKRYLRERVIDPLALPGFTLGLPPAQGGDVAQLTAVGDVASPDELEAALGIRALPGIDATAPDQLLFLNVPDILEAGLPGGGAVATAADIALYYQALLHNPGGMWDETWLADARNNVRNRLPERLTQVPANRTIAWPNGGDDGWAGYRGFGKTTSPETFGHNGAGGQVAWADPATGISFGYLTNGLDRNFIREGKRGVGLSSRAGALLLER